MLLPLVPDAAADDATDEPPPSPMLPPMPGPVLLSMLPDLLYEPREGLCGLDAIFPSRKRLFRKTARLFGARREQLLRPANKP
mmetsp:Transcript_33548/g.85837  ORF Transcript_33548/g.85837 Transcript_33548/m.85837 type:complete len:83 (-) Transcript_33548:9-257(-)